MTKSSAYADVFQSLHHWAEEARAHSAACPPDVSLLLAGIPSVSRSITRAGPSCYQGQTVIRFDVKGQGGIGIKTRHVLPVHFAMLRILDLIPYARLVLKDDPHKHRPKKGGRLPAPEEIMYYLSLSVAGDKAKALSIPRMIKADRILFNAPPDATLHERRSGDYRYIVPSGSVLLRHHGDPLITQDSLLRAIQELAEDQTMISDIRPYAVIDLLSMLFSIGDDWHWGELLDRNNETDPHRGQTNCVERGAVIQ